LRGLKGLRKHGPCAKKTKDAREADPKT